MISEWRPSAARDMLELRARVLACIRHFFQENQVLEVETPILETAATTDPHIQSFQSGERFLRTSPELAMKRLLAADSGDIYQIAKVFREQESGVSHNPEFTMLEWYRVGWDYHQLMDETETLLRRLFLPYRQLAESKRIDCIDWFNDIYKIDLLSRQRDEQLIQQAQTRGLRDCSVVSAAFDFLMDTAAREHFNAEQLVFVYRYPDIQPLLAAADGSGAVQRFEVYWKQFELVNGYTELRSAEECLHRFAQDNQQRASQGQSRMPISAPFVAAMEHGMPLCAGAALGIDRVLLCLSGADDIADTLAFPWEQS